MSWFNNLGLQAKLMTLSGLLLVMMAIVAVIGVKELNAAANRADAMQQQNVLGTHWANQTFAWVVASGREQQSAILNAEDAQKRAASIALGREEMGKAQDALKEYRKTFINAADEKAWAEVEKQVGAVIADREALFKQLESGDIAGAASAGALLAPKITEMNKTLDGVINANLDAGEATRKAADAAAASSRTLLIGITIFAVVVGLALSIYLARSISGAARAVVSRLESIQQNCLANLRTGMEALAGGDLTFAVTPVTPKIDRFTQDEVGRAAAATNDILDKMVATIASYNEARGSLSGMVTEVRGNAASILGASGQLQDASDQMAAATGQIATAINEVTRSAVSLSSLSQDSAREIERVAAGSEELAAAAQENSATAGGSRQEATSMGERIGLVANASQEVATSAEESRQAALEGQKAVQQAVASMESIASAVDRASATVNQLGEYGQQIGDIVKAIDEIASQTNLLALNAAIEAARAGEQGRGFAVVAENVRNLAERSSGATKEIAALIAKVQAGTQEAVQAMAIGVKDVEHGREITTQAGASLSSIIGSVQESAVQMKRIASDVQGLAAGAEAIVTSAVSIAASAEQSAEGAGEMAQGTSRVTEAILQVSATSEQTSASAEEVSASTEELSAQSEELAATAAQMKNLAEALAGATARFKTA
ncbi:MAG: MCP four helix bundle domain-containing protein [Chloroflexi bacterium]|nr:MCP four helix bundle domain-containing protein [Chloroflexota bacterium]